MLEADYIKRAVELCPGFDLLLDGENTLVWRGPYFLDIDAVDPPHQVYLDALAAELVRQVDALGEPCFFSSDAMRWSIVGSKDGKRCHYGQTPDRTMNTIRAIVDSKVLEK